LFALDKNTGKVYKISLIDTITNQNNSNPTYYSTFKDYGIGSTNQITVTFQNGHQEVATYDPETDTFTNLVAGD